MLATELLTRLIVSRALAVEALSSVIAIVEVDVVPDTVIVISSAAPANAAAS